MSPSRPREIAVVLFLGLLGGAVASIFLGQDVNWDLQNYHFYTPHALLNHRYELDLMPAGIVQTYLNPLVYIIPYLLITTFPPIWVGALQGMLHGANLVLVWAIARRVLSTVSDGSRSNHRGQRYIEYAAVTAVGVTAPIFLSVLGTSFAGATLSLPVLAAVLLAVPLVVEDEHSGHRHRRQSGRVLTAGLLVGAGAGLKLTGGVYVAALVLALVIALPRHLKGRLAALNIIGAMAGFVVTGGPWAWFIWSRLGSPVFPLFNRFFRSPYYLSANFSDTRWIPDSAAQALFYPFQWAAGGHPTTEVPFRDARFAIVSVLLVVTIPALWIWARRGRRMVTAESRRCVFLLTFFLAAYGIWIVQLAQRRFIVVLELISGIALAAFLRLILPAGRLRHIAVIVLCVIAVLTGQPANWGRLRWNDDWFGVRVPPGLQTDSTLFVMANGEPDAFVIPFLPPSSRFVRLAGLTELYRETYSEMIEHHQGPVRTLGAAGTSSAANAALVEIDRFVDTDSCEVLETRLKPIQSCVVVQMKDDDFRTLVTIRFDDAHSRPQALVAGWSQTEPWGTWTEGQQARLLFRLPPAAGGSALELQMRAVAFITSDVPLQIVGIRVNDSELAPVRFDASRQSQFIRRLIPPTVREQGDVLEILFEISNPTSPVSVGLSSDSRELGFGLHWLRVLATDAGESTRSSAPAGTGVR
jgi:hypothetical protein